MQGCNVYDCSVERKEESNILRLIHINTSIQILSLNKVNSLIIVVNVNA